MKEDLGIPHRLLHRHKNRPKNPGHSFVTCFLIWRLLKGKLYGYMLLDELNNLGIGGCRQSTVYMLLRKLEKMGFVKSEQKFVSNRTRKIYSITPSGRRLFEYIKNKGIKGSLKEFLRELAN